MIYIFGGERLKMSMQLNVYGTLKGLDSFKFITVTKLVQPLNKFTFNLKFYFIFFVLVYIRSNSL